MQAKKVLDAAIMVISPIGICLTAKYPTVLFIDPIIDRTNSHVRFPTGKIGSFLKSINQYHGIYTLMGTHCNIVVSIIVELIITKYLYITIGNEIEKMMANLTQDIVKGPTSCSILTITFERPLVAAQMQIRKSARKGEIRLLHRFLSTK